MRIRFLGMMALTASGFGVLLTAACSDDGGGSGPNSTDAGKTTIDAGQSDGDAKVPVADATADVGTDAADSGDAGPTLSVTTGLNGRIEIEPTSVLAEFRLEDTIIRASDAPGCVAMVRAAARESERIDVGTMRIGGDAVGQDGGIPSPLSPPFDSEGKYYYGSVGIGESLFFPGISSRVQVQIENGYPEVGIHPMPVTTLRSSPFGMIHVLTPALPDAGSLVVRSDQDFNITWNVPTTGGADAGGAGERMILDLFFLLGTGGARAADIRCSAPVAAGRGSLPASLLREVKVRLSPSAPIEGAKLRIRSGDQREVVIPGGPGGFDATYWIELSSPFESTDFAVEAGFGGETEGTVVLD